MKLNRVLTGHSIESNRHPYAGFNRWIDLAARVFRVAAYENYLLTSYSPTGPTHFDLFVGKPYIRHVFIQR